MTAIVRAGSSEAVRLTEPGSTARFTFTVGQFSDRHIVFRAEVLSSHAPDDAEGLPFRLQVNGGASQAGSAAGLAITPPAGAHIVVEIDESTRAASASNHAFVRVSVDEPPLIADSSVEVVSQ